MLPFLLLFFLSLFNFWRCSPYLFFFSLGALIPSLFLSLHRILQSWIYNFIKYEWHRLQSAAATAAVTYSHTYLIVTYIERGVKWWPKWNGSITSFYLFIILFCHLFHGYRNKTILLMLRTMTHICVQNYWWWWMVCAGMKERATTICRGMWDHFYAYNSIWN